MIMMCCLLWADSNLARLPNAEYRPALPRGTRYKMQTHRGDDNRGTSLGKALILPGTHLCLPWEESSPLQPKLARKLGGFQQVMSKLLSKPNGCDQAKG